MVLFVHMHFDYDSVLSHITALGQTGKRLIRTRTHEEHILNLQKYPTA